AGSVNNSWEPTQLIGCDGTSTVQPPNDIVICNGQMREATDDGGTVTSMAMYPKQPFDFSGRTGTVGFDVSNNTQYGHAAWPELWITDKPVPDPFVHEDSWASIPQNGFGIKFDGCANESGQSFTCPRGDAAGGVAGDAVTIVNNSVARPGTVTGLGDVLKSTAL